MHIESYGISDIGKKRQNNEDVFAILAGYGFYALADGMGGHQAGEIAAQMTVDSLCRRIIGDDDFRLPLPSSSLLDRLLNAIQETNQHVYKKSVAREDWSGMGTTLSCLLLHEDLLFYGHVGDSRIYRYRDRLEQITKDHTSRSEKKKGKITKAIGTSCTLEPEVGIVAPLTGDLFLICSDGLTDYLSDSEIEQILIETNDLSFLCQKLVNCANSRGGHDNITVLVLKVEEN
jgi:serine/threonine protein phosphatase PrpC